MKLKSIRTIKGAEKLKSVAIYEDKVFGVTPDYEIICMGSVEGETWENTGSVAPRKKRVRKEAKISLDTRTDFEAHAA